MHYIMLSAKENQASDDQYKIQANLCREFTVGDYLMVRISLERFPPEPLENCRPIVLNYSKC